MAYRALFLDRDGTINYDPGYLGDPEAVKLYPGVAEGIKKIKELPDFKIIVISNQSGISRNLISHDDVKAVNRRINELLRISGAGIDAFYYCPFHPDFSGKDEVNCRKPSPQMLLDAAADHDVDLSASFMVGDKGIDVECGINAGVKTILLKHTMSETEINSLLSRGKTPNFVAENFLEACDFIIKELSGEFN